MIPAGGLLLMPEGATAATVGKTSRPRWLWLHGTMTARK